MIAALAGLCLCQLIGEFVVRAFALPLPGPVFGMFLLFLFLLFRGGGGQGAEAIPKSLSNVADVLIGHLSLLFVPASVGIMRYFDLLADNFVAIAVAVAASTIIGQAVTALTFRAFTRA